LYRWNLAKKMVSESYGLIFGLNSFVALILQALLTVIVVDKRGFGMTVRSQVSFFSSIYSSPKLFLRIPSFINYHNVTWIRHVDMSRTTLSMLLVALTKCTYLMRI
ncbi:hypothetical protein LOAG_16198, partial [Loa loa]